MKLGVGMCVLMVLVFSSSLLADTVPIVNGGFETGTLAGWTTRNNVQVTTSQIGVAPTQGIYQAILETGVIGAGFSDVSANTFLSFVATYLGGFLPMGGATLEQSFEADAGSVIHFDWDFLSSDYPYDFALFDLDGSLYALAINGVNTPTLPSATEFGLETGYQSFSLQIPTSGTHHIGFGVWNGWDNLVQSGLLIDNVKATPGVVPEPSTWVLLSSGLVGIGFVRIRRRRTQR